MEAGVLGLANGIVEIELRSEIPLAIVCMLTADVVCMEGEEGLVGTHAGSPGVELLHEKIKLGRGEEWEWEGGTGRNGPCCAWSRAENQTCV